MKGRLELIAYVKKEALCVPLNMIKKDWSENREYVFIRGGDSKKVKTFIEVGRKNSEEAEVLSGLKKGDTLIKP